MRSSYVPSSAALAHLSYVHCSGNENMLSQCRSGRLYYYQYRYCYDKAGAICNSKWIINETFLFRVIITVTSEPECNETDIRLVNGAAANEGRVEICHSGLWRSICDNDWRVADSLVVCRQLGYGSEYCCQ